MEKTLKQIELECLEHLEDEKIELEFFQSNSESEIIDKIHVSQNFDGIIINAGAFTHTSIAIHDALKIIKVPKIEVHISIFIQERSLEKNLL